MENPIPDEDSGMSHQEAINQGYKLFLSATLTFGELIDEEGEMLSYDFKECFKELNEETVKDFFKRVSDEVCELLEEDWYELSWGMYGAICGTTWKLV